MHVMTAGMHVAVGRSKIHVGFLAHWQRVHVCTQHQTLLTLAELGDDTVAVNKRLERHAHLRQLLLDEGAGLRQLKAELRCLVQLTAPGAERILHGLGFIKDRSIHVYHVLSCARRRFF